MSTKPDLKGLSEDELPKPTGYRILILPAAVPEKSDGGLVYAEETRQAMAFTRNIGHVVAMGPQCFDHEKYMGERWCEVGDVIQFSQYSGNEIYVETTEKKANGQPIQLMFRMINDDQVLSVVPDPDRIQTRM